MDEKSITVPDLGNGLFENDANAGGMALHFEHRDDVACGSVAEKLPKGFFVEGDAVLFHECDEIARCIASEGGARKVGVGGEKSVSAAIEVSEVAAAPAGDEDLFADAIGMIENENAAAMLARSNSGHKARCSSAEHQDIAGFFVMVGGHGHAGLF
jgi:hypothetical protein